MAELVIIKHPDTPNAIMRIYASEHDPAVHGPALTEDEATAYVAGELEDKPKTRRSRSEPASSE